MLIFKTHFLNLAARRALPIFGLALMLALGHRQTRAAEPPAALTPTALANAEYLIPDLGTFRLTNSAFDDDERHIHISLIDQPRTTGDVNGDDVADAVVHLAVNTGGSGVFSYVSLVANDNGAPKALASGPIGDRVNVRSFSIAKDGTVLARFLERRIDEPMIARPTVAAARSFRWTGTQLIASSALAATDILYAQYPFDGATDGKAFFGTGSFVNESTGLVARLLKQPRATGDLNGDGSPDSVVVVESTSESGEKLTMMYALLNQQYTAAPLAAVIIGDRIKLTKLSITNGRVVVDFLDHKTGQSLAARPTTQRSAMWTLQNGRLIQAAP